MRIRSFYTDKKTRTIAWIIFPVIPIVIILFLFYAHSFITVCDSSLNPYLVLVERLANRILVLSGIGVEISNHSVISYTTPIYDFTTSLRYRKILILILLVVWLTKTSFKNKSLISIVLIVVHFLANVAYCTVGAYSATMPESMYLLAFPNTITVLILYTILFRWYVAHKKVILESLTRFRTIREILLKKDKSVIIIIYLYIILSCFLLDYFELLPWINFLFSSSQKILTVLGYEATLEPFYLIGSNGSIYMSKFCLGFKTMALFSAVVYLTGDKDKNRWIYIFLGIIFLNIINILRFVLLFIHIQRNGGYNLALGVHDLYNLITYSIVFILWIIWFEVFSDVRKKKYEIKSLQ
jgi:exosortase/archaeosortase family protein